MLVGNSDAGSDCSAAADRYRFQQALWDANFTELGFAQQDAATRDGTFAFARVGTDNALTVVVLSNDFAKRAITLRDLPAAAWGRELCDIERLTCHWVSKSGGAPGDCRPVLSNNPGMLQGDYEGGAQGVLALHHWSSAVQALRGLQTHVCVCAGTLNVTLGGHGEPWVLVDPSDLRSNEFFSRPKQVPSNKISHTP